MRTILTAAALMLLSVSANSQSLLDIYKKGEINLTPDYGFAQSTDWEKLFSDYSETKYGNPIGTYKDLVMSDDGLIFVSNYSGYSIYKFDSDGDFVMQFGSEGNATGEFRNRPSLHGVLDNKYVFTSEHNGRLNFFDLDGKFIKLVELDYMPLECIALGNGKIAVVGHVPYGGGDVRYIVAVKDINTADENIVSSFIIKDNERRNITFKMNDGLMSIGNPFSKTDIFIRRSLNGNLIVGYSNREEIEVYDPDGSLLKSFKHNIVPITISEEDKQEFRQSVKKSLEKANIPEDISAKTDAPDFFPDHMPYFYNMLVDSDGNLLVFGYNETDIRHKFRVYSYLPDGKFICETVLNADNFDIKLNKKFNQLCFHERYLYGIAPKADETGIPLKLVKFKLTE